MLRDDCRCHVVMFDAAFGGGLIKPEMMKVSSQLRFQE